MLIELFAKSKPSTSRLVALATAIVFAFISQLDGQQLGGPYKDVNNWTVTYKVIIKTKCDKFCTIHSEETTEGQSDWVINYSIYREFGGGYFLGGPIAGDQMPKASLPLDAKSNPPSPDEIRKLMLDLTKYVGWQYPGPGMAIKEQPVIHVKVNDDFDLTGKSQECTKSSYEINKTARFDRDLVVKYAFADLALDLATDHYSVRLNILPANPGDELNLVRVKTVQSSQSDDPNDKSNDAKTSTTTVPVSSYLIDSEKSVRNPDLIYRGGLAEGTDDIHLCRQENIKNFDYYNPEVTKDVEKNKTLVVMFALTMHKGIIPLSPSNACD